MGKKKKTYMYMNAAHMSDHNDMQLLPITSYGWNLKDEVLTIDWDSAENISAVKERVMLLTKGCKCKTG